MIRFKIFLFFLFFFLSGITVFAQRNDNPVREDIEWIDVYMPHTNEAHLPRILLIGNSITRGYYPTVVKELDGKAYVARLSTSKSVGDPAILQEINLIMSYYHFDIIHFNNGLHGFGYTEEQYKKAFPDFVKTIRKNAPHGKLMWATITPVHDPKNIAAYGANIERIKERNRIVSDYLRMQPDIKVDDLWSFAMAHPEFYEGGDGTHPVDAGFQALGKKVAEALRPLLEQSKKK